MRLGRAAGDRSRAASVVPGKGFYSGCKWEDLGGHWVDSRGLGTAAPPGNNQVVLLIRK